MIQIADDKVTKRYRGQLEKSKNEIRACLKNRANRQKIDKMPEELFNRLNQFLDDKNQHSIVFVSVDDRPEAEAQYGYSGGYCVWIRPKSFETQGKGRQKGRLTAVLFHELVHVACGAELDAEYYENLFFEGKGATSPTKQDLQQMKDDNFEGYWMRLDTKSVHAMDLWRNDLGKLSNHINLHKFLKEVGVKMGVKLENK